MNINDRRFWLLFLLPISLTTFLAWFLFLPLPVADYWDVLYGGVKLDNPSLLNLFQYSWQPFVDQKMVFPKLLIYYLATTTENTHYGIEILFGFICQGGVLLLLASLLHKTPALSPQLKTFLLIIFSWLLFWPNILVRFQHHWYSTQYSFVLLFAMLSIWGTMHFKGKWFGVIWALFFAICSAISHGTGLIYLLCYMTATVAFPIWSKSQKISIVVIASSILALIIREIPPRETIGLPPLNWFTYNPLDELVFMFRCFGPDGVLRAQTGFLTLALGLGSGWVLFKRGKLFSGDYFSWLLIFFWGASTALISGITRSAVSSSPFRFYFYFFVVVLVSVMVLTAIILPENIGEKKGKGVKFAWFVLIGLYSIGCHDGIYDATKMYKRNLLALERLHYQPLLVDEDYKYLFPFPRIKKTMTDLHERGMLDAVDTRPFTERGHVNFTTEMQGNELHFIPSRPILPGEVIAFPRADYISFPSTILWQVAGRSWTEEQSQQLQLRLFDDQFWVIFSNQNLPRLNKPIVAVKLKFNQRFDISVNDLPMPTVWKRPQ